MEPILRLKEIFWDAFHRPALTTQQFKQVWESNEAVNNLLAGPLYALYTEGNCDYVFKDNLRFPDIETPDDLLNWCMYLVEKYKDAIEKVVVHSQDEKQDQAILLYQTDLKMELSDLAYTIVIKQMLRS